MRMLVRFVKMKFEADKVEDFLANFEASKEKIRNFEGCMFLELLQDINDKTIFFTHSHWRSENNLNDYRNSELFKNVWSKTKPLFAEKAEAWSVLSVGSNP